MGGFMRPYANSIGSDIIEQIGCLSFVCESFFGKILSYIFWGCMLGLMSAELITPESKISFVKGRPQDRKTNQDNILISGVDVGRKQRTPSTPASASIMGTLDAAV